jgi:hypothetical protein
MQTEQACPAVDVLEQFALGGLAGVEREAVERHVPDCSRCGVLLGALRPTSAGAATPPGAATWPAGRPGRVATPSPAAEAVRVLAPPEGPDELGRLGGYRVLSVIGSGGMGVVFLAEDPLLQRPVALKVMAPATAADPVCRERFLREAKATAAVEHDRIVAIHHVGEDRGFPFLAMPVLRGESLEDRLDREGKLPAAEVLRVGQEIAEGLQAAHRHGLIHRDVKPANVWLEAETGRVKLFDFGLALAGRESARLTKSGLIVGTPCYMAPEQSRGLEVDARSDLFSLGCVLYRAATGQVPFSGDDVMTVLSALALQDPLDPVTVDPTVPPLLSDLILRLLAKDPADRPPSAGATADLLRALASGETWAARTAQPPAAPDVVPGTPGAPAPGAALAARRPRRRWPLAVAAALALAAAGVASRLPVFSQGSESSGPDGNRSPAPPPGSDLATLEASAADPGTDRAAVADLARAWWRDHAASPDSTRAARLLRRLPSPLDRLDSSQLAGKPADLPGLVALVRGHVGAVVSVAFSPDGRTLASGGGEQDQTVAVWDLGAAAPRLRYRGEPLGSAVSTVAFAPGGRTLAASAWDGTVRLWDVTADVPRAGDVLRQPQACFTCLAFAGDGHRLAAGTAHGVVWLWELGQTPLPPRALRPERLGIVSGVAFRAGGQTVAAGGADVRLWDLAAKGVAETALPGERQGEVRGLAFSPDGRSLAAGLTTGVIRQWDVAGVPAPGPWLRRHTDKVRSLAFSPDGRFLASGGWDGRVVLWEAAGGAARRQWEVPGEHVQGVAFAPDCRHLAFGAGNNVYVVRLGPPGEP